jgi:glycosyltransferase involved in cell wall biosynthesis
LGPSDIGKTPAPHTPSGASSEAGVGRWRRAPAAGKYTLLALLPVYNREDLLPQCLEALRPAVDGIIALDDGSTDETPHILREEPKVIEILTKPPKSLAAWDDAANRYLLYRAAHAYEPEWLLCIDSDEILEPTFQVYKDRLMEQPPRIQGYAFPLVAIHQNKITGPLLVDRMYRFRPGYSFDTRRLHCRLMPLDIKDEMMRTANVRIFHHSASPEQKESRYNKYLIADPEREFQASYENLLRTNPSRPLLPVGGELELTPFADDTVELKRFFPEVDLESETTRGHLLYLQAHLGELVGLMKDFHGSTLDFFYVESPLQNGDYRLTYQFSPPLSPEVPAPLAWLVEKYRVRKDFFYLAAGLAAFLNLEWEEAAGAFATVLGRLKELKVLV